MICTTLNKIRAHRPCADGWEKLLQHLAETHPDLEWDDPLPMAVIVKSNGLQDALWATRTLPEHDREWRLYAVWCARQVQHLMTDPRSLAALDVAERHAHGQATDDELAAAKARARAASGSAARAADAAAWASGAAERAAMDAADAASEAARAAAWAAAWDAAWAAQTKRFLEVVGGEK